MQPDPARNDPQTDRFLAQTLPLEVPRPTAESVLDLFESEDGGDPVQAEYHPEAPPVPASAGTAPVSRDIEMDTVRTSALSTTGAPAIGPTEPNIVQDVTSPTIRRLRTQANEWAPTKRGEADILDLVSRVTRLEIRREKKKVRSTARTGTYVSDCSRSGTKS